MKKKKKVEKNLQLRVLEQVTDKAIKQVELESRNNPRNYIVEWFRYVELASKDLHKYLN